MSILLHDGSILFAPQYSVKDGQLHLRDHPLQDAPIPLQSIAEVVHGHAPNHVERAEARWEKHSEMGQQFLGDRTRKAMDIIKKFREAQFRLAAADKQFIKAKRALPAAEKSELAAKVKRDDALPSLTAPTALVKTHTDAHNQTLQVLTTAENKAAADCTRTGQSYNIWWQTVQFKRRPALQALAEAQLAWLQAKPDQRPALEQKRAQAAQDLARINEEIKRHRTELDTHLQTGLNSDQAVTAAQARQGATLQKLSAAPKPWLRFRMPSICWIRIGWRKRPKPINFEAKSTGPNAIPIWPKAKSESWNPRCSPHFALKPDRLPIHIDNSPVAFPVKSANFFIKSHPWGFRLKEL